LPGRIKLLSCTFPSSFKLDSYFATLACSICCPLFWFEIAYAASSRGIPHSETFCSCHSICILANFVDGRGHTKSIYFDEGHPSSVASCSRSVS
jgi:hypothetical protein